MENQPLFIKMALSAWDTYLARADKLLNSLSDEELQKETAPGRNTGVYLLGHLTAIHDALFPLLELGEKLYPQLDDIFVKNPDKSGLEKPPTGDLRKNWTEVNKRLADQFNRLTAGEWMQRHNAVSEADFVNEPHRNKLNVVINRTNHLANHLGQLLFLVSK